jgi:hypothetical protein
MPSKLHLLAFGSLLLSLLALAGGGCASTSGSDSTSFASVTIQGHTVEEIASATARVFRENGYSGGDTGDNQMIFRKAGSKMNDLAYGGFAGSYYGEKTQVRVKAEIINLQGGSCRLRCQAYMVRGAGDSFFEEEQMLARIRSGKYQSMLDQVAKKLK